jgi:transcriptional regulator with XRE-family HTH domain
MMATTVMAPPAQPVGELLRTWRERRRLSQLALALDAEVSTRHLSFLETGRSRPSREMLLRLMERLEVPLLERNRILLSAGYAPLYPERPLDDPVLQPARQAVDRVLAAHKPYPAHAVDRHWTLVASNDVAWPLIGEVAPALLEPPINVLRLSLHPEGLAPRILNLGQWRAHILHRLRQQVESSADPVLDALLNELAAYPASQEEGDEAQLRDLYASGVVTPLRLQSSWGVLALFSTITIFGTPVDITLSELAIEAFFPADEATEKILRRIADDPAVRGPDQSRRSQRGT